MPSTPELWVYRCRVETVGDGDTLALVHVDLGFRVVTGQRMRVLGVNTPEVRGGDEVSRSKAQAATAFTVKWLAEHADHLGGGLTRQWPLTLRSSRSDSFGRWLAQITCGQGHDLAAALLEANMAVPYARKRAAGGAGQGQR
jgi:endonuclease YncB( thermonuclease family)